MRTLKVIFPLVLLAHSAGAAPATIQSRLADLERTLRCGQVDAPDDPERHAVCLVAKHWQEAKADALPPGDTALVGVTLEVPDVRAADWHPVNVPAVGGIRVGKTESKVCEMDAYGDNAAQRAAVAAVKSPLLAAFQSLDATPVVPSAIAEEAAQRPAGAIRSLKKHGESWTTKFQSAVELRHLGNRWFLIEERQGNSGLWISVFTASFSVAK